MQVYVQKATRTTFPRRPSAVSGGELSHPVAPSQPGRWPSSEWRWTPKKLATDISGSDAVGERDQRLALLDDIRRQLQGVLTADVLHRVERLGGDEEDLAGVHRRR